MQVGFPRQAKAHWFTTTSVAAWRGDMLCAQRHTQLESLPHVDSQRAVAWQVARPRGTAPLHTDARTQDAALLQSFTRWAQAAVGGLAAHWLAQVASAYMPQRGRSRQPSAHACWSVR